jgi:hypothetical protein
MKEIISYIIPSLSFLLSLTTFITNERRARRKEREGQMKAQQNDSSSLPPRRTRMSR